MDFLHIGWKYLIVVSMPFLTVRNINNNAIIIVRRINFNLISTDKDNKLNELRTQIRPFLPSGDWSI